jgi:hypothetical protein
MRRSLSVAAAVAAGLLALGTATTANAAAQDASSCVGAVVAPPPATTRSGVFADAIGGHATWLTTLSCTDTGRTHALEPAGQTNNLASTNWSGYQVNQSAGYAQGGWTVPTVNAPVPGYSSIGYYSSTWAGIGGGFNAGGGALIQAGTAQSISNTGVTSYYAWYEIVGGTGDTHHEVRINNLPIHPGDYVGGVALWTAATGAQMGVCDFTTNVCVNFTVPSSAPGTTAEWIVEAPSAGGTLPLANFHSVTFSNSCWSATYVPGGPCNTIRAGGAQAITLQQYAFNTWQNVAIPRPLTANGLGFVDDYYQPRPQGPPCGGGTGHACP